MAFSFSPSPRSPSSCGVFSPPYAHGSVTQSEDGQDGSLLRSYEHPGGRKSVKYLTCWYWQNGGCKKTDDECLYSHHSTGIQADRPRPVRPGGPVVAGKNALIHDEQEKSQRPAGPPGLDYSPGFHAASSPMSLGYDSVDRTVSPLVLTPSTHEGRVIGPPPGFSGTPRRARPQEDYRSPSRHGETLHPDSEDPFHGFRDIIGPPLAVHPNKRLRTASGEYLAVGRSASGPGACSEIPLSPHWQERKAEAELKCATATAAILGQAVQKHLSDLYNIREELARFEVPAEEPDHPMLRLQASLDGSFLELNDQLKVAKRELQGAASYEAVFPRVNNPWNDNFRYRSPNSTS